MMYELERKLKTYTTDEVKAGVPVRVRFDLYIADAPTYEVIPINIDKITNKTIMTRGGSRISIDNDMGWIKGYYGLYCLEADVDEMVLKYKDAYIYMYQKKIENAQLEIDTISRLVVKTKEEI